MGHFDKIISKRDIKQASSPFSLPSKAIPLNEFNEEITKTRLGLIYFEEKATTKSSNGSGFSSHAEPV